MSQPGVDAVGGVKAGVVFIGGHQVPARLIIGRNDDLGDVACAGAGEHGHWIIVQRGHIEVAVGVNEIHGAKIRWWRGFVSPQ